MIAAHVGSGINTYQWFPKPSIIKDGRYRGVEVVQIDLAVGLQFVEKIEETECRSGARTVPGGRKPPSTEQLDTGWSHKTIRSTALAVRNVDGVDASDVEHSERYWGGGDGASAAAGMAEVEDGAEGFQRHPFKMLPCPMLREISYPCRNM